MTVRHYYPSTIEQLTKGKTILLEQKPARTAMVIRRTKVTSTLKAGSMALYRKGSRSIPAKLLFQGEHEIFFRAIQNSNPQCGDKTTRSGAGRVFQCLNPESRCPGIKFFKARSSCSSTSRQAPVTLPAFIKTRSSVRTHFPGQY